ncbi:hypothetical protein EDB85DRAFT_2274125 [Lactarius pseudohatsudake]|nr:hypothetical protein EDB85DRAFT_2274125 [Lactarius pseudohatsudake]
MQLPALLSMWHILWVVNGTVSADPVSFGHWHATMCGPRKQKSHRSRPARNLIGTMSPFRVTGPLSPEVTSYRVRNRLENEPIGSATFAPQASGGLSSELDPELEGDPA